MGGLEWGVGVREEGLEGSAAFDKSPYRIKLHLLAEQERFAAGGESLRASAGVRMKRPVRWAVELPSWA